jgi:hypothetical protein
MDPIHTEEATDYVEIAKLAFSHELVEKINKIPQEDLFLLKKALSKLPEQNDDNNHLNPTWIALGILERVLSNETSYNMLLKFPKHMKMQVCEHKKTTDTISDKEIEVKREFNNDAIREKVLQIASRGRNNRLEKMFGISSADLIALNHERISKEKHPHQVENKEYKKMILKNISIERIVKPSDFENENIIIEDLFLTIGEDETIEVFSENQSSNLIVIPVELEKAIKLFTEAQLQQSDRSHSGDSTFYLDIKPVNKKTRGVWVYPEREDFEIITRTAANPFLLNSGISKQNDNNNSDQAAIIS